MTYDEILAVLIKRYEHTLRDLEERKVSVWDKKQELEKLKAELEVLRAPKPRKPRPTVVDIETGDDSTTASIVYSKEFDPDDPVAHFGNDAPGG